MVLNISYNLTMRDILRDNGLLKAQKPPTDEEILAKQAKLGGGLPPDRFAKTGWGTYMSPSRHNLEYNVHPNCVQVFDRDVVEGTEKEPLYVFKASLCRDLPNNGMLTLGVRSKRPEEDDSLRHPDIYPSIYLHWTLKYFGQIGDPVNKVLARWNADEDSVNYTAYINQLNGRLSEARYGERVAAAKTTWTGRTLARYGFTRVSSLVDDQPGAVYIEFSKPSASLANRLRGALDEVLASKRRIRSR